jgi:integrase/recombinase XerD
MNPPNNKYPDLPFSKAIEGFLLSFKIDHSPNTVKLYELYLGIACDWMDDPPISKIDTQYLRRFMVYLKTDYDPNRVGSSTRKHKPLGPSARDNHWKALRSCFRWLHEYEIIEDNPTLDLARPKVPKKEPDPFSEDDIKKLLYAAAYVKVTRDGKTFYRGRPTARRNIALILLLLDTGIRLGELSRLKFADLRLDVGDIHIRPYSTGRKSRERYLPLGKRTRKALWLYLSSIEDPDPTHRLFGLDKTPIQQLLYRIAKQEEVPKTHPHRFRHTFAIEYLRNGGDVFTLQRILGHSTLDMVNYYLKLVQTDLEETHKRASPADRWEL